MSLKRINRDRRKNKYLDKLLILFYNWRLSYQKKGKEVPCENRIQHQNMANAPLLSGTGHAWKNRTVISGNRRFLL